MAKDKKFGKGFFCGILTSAVVVLAGSGVLQQGGWITGADQKEAGATQESTDSAGTQLSLDQKKVDTKIKKMEEIINQLYLDSTDNDTVEAGIYKGMISGLGDPYAAYYTQDELEKFMGTKVYLQTWVKVKENWRDSQYLIGNFGYTNDD